MVAAARAFRDGGEGVGITCKRTGGDGGVGGESIGGSVWCS